MGSFGDHSSSLFGNGAIWTSMSYGNHKCRFYNKNFRRSIACINYHANQNEITRELNDTFRFQIS